jgi:hypothetical protein
VGRINDPRPGRLGPGHDLVDLLLRGNVVAEAESGSGEGGLAGGEPGRSTLCTTVFSPQSVFIYACQASRSLRCGIEANPGVFTRFFSSFQLPKPA